MNLSLKSSAFTANTDIPRVYTCQGSDYSPPLSWQDNSDKTKSYVLIMDDPDAPHGTWDHWVLFNIPPNVKELAENAKTPAGAVDGKNSWGKTGYGGPCPPSGKHRYFFKIYALDNVLNLPAESSKQQVIETMTDHILGSAELMGLYQKT